MSINSAIEWTDNTWNPTTGCERVSPGCDNCYAMTFAERFRGVVGHYFEHGFDVQLRPNMLERPMQWVGHKRVFVNSMSDLFHKDVQDQYLDSVFSVMDRAPQHIYQVLTKRPERMRRYLRSRYANGVPDHIWLGVSIENNDYAWRADMLRDIDAPIRFLSVEPMLGPIDKVSLKRINWVIVGGESGRRHRPLEVAWVRDVRDRCLTEQIAFFFKQWHKSGTGRLLDEQTWDEMPQLRTLLAGP